MVVERAWSKLSRVIPSFLRFAASRGTEEKLKSTGNDDRLQATGRNGLLDCFYDRCVPFDDERRRLLVRQISARRSLAAVNDVQVEVNELRAERECRVLLNGGGNGREGELADVDWAEQKKGADCRRSESRRKRRGKGEEETTPSALRRASRRTGEDAHSTLH